MKHNHTATLLALIVTLLASTTLAFDESQYTSLSVVLRGNDSVNGANDDTRLYFGDWCDIDFPPDGSLRSGIYGSQGLWNTDFSPNPNSLCTSPVRYKLQRDGNFIIKCSADNTIDYITHSNQGRTGDFLMAIDNSCELHIFEGTFGCNELDIHQEIWSSDKYGPWEIDDTLHKGQIYHGLSWYEVVMDPLEGNLEVRNPGSHGTYDIVWQAKDEWDAPPGDNLHDFYAKLTGGGRLILVGIDYQNGKKQEEYFSKTLKRTGGGDCFTLGFEVAGSDPYGVSDPIDFIAVPCE